MGGAHLGSFASGAPRDPQSRQRLHGGNSPSNRQETRGARGARGEPGRARGPALGAPAVAGGFPWARAPGDSAGLLAEAEQLVAVS